MPAASPSCHFDYRRRRHFFAPPLSALRLIADAIIDFRFPAFAISLAEPATPFR
jgi:hypothetical protein